MQDFIQSAVAQLGISEDQAKSATGGLLSFLKNRGEGNDVQALIAKLPGAEGPIASGSAGGSGAGALLGGLASGLGGQLGGAERRRFDRHIGALESKRRSPSVQAGACSPIASNQAHQQAWPISCPNGPKGATA